MSRSDCSDEFDGILVDPDFGRKTSASPFPVAIQPPGYPDSGPEVVLWVPEQYLAMNSRVFATMIYDKRFEEASNGRIVLREQNPSEMLELFKCCIPHLRDSIGGCDYREKPVDPTNVDMLLRLSDQYEMPQLQRKCESFLETKLSNMNPAKDDLLELLKIASKHRMKSLLSKIIPLCANLEVTDVEKVQESIPCNVIAMIYRGMIDKWQPPAPILTPPPLGHLGFVAGPNQSHAACMVSSICRKCNNKCSRYINNGGRNCNCIVEFSSSLLDRF